MKVSVPALGGGVDNASRGAALRALVEGERPLVLPGIFDSLTAILAERAGFDACYLTGAGLANTMMGVPDVGLLSSDAIVAHAMRIAAVTTIPLVADIDTGFGGPSSVMHLVRALETVGVSAIQMEDQAMPKRCGHFDRKHVILTAEMQTKIDAATRARRDPNFLIIARTDAVAVEGFDAAVKRVEAYREAGADILFIEAPDKLTDIEALPRRITGIPLLMNVVPGGKTPELTAAELHTMGYQIHLHANLLMRSMTAAGITALEALHNGGTRGTDLPFITWEERQSIVRLADFDAIEDELSARWGY